MTALAPDPDGERILREAEDVVQAEQSVASIQEVFTIAAHVGVMLNIWRKTMLDGGHRHEWVEARCTDLFLKFFPPNAT